LSRAQSELNSIGVPFSGGCACRSIRYVCSAAPVAMLNCHCLDCQRFSGTPQTFAVRAGSGKLATRSFCPECGSPLFTRGEVAPEVLSIRFSTLDDPSAFKPMLDIWTCSAQPWVCLSQAIPHYPRSP